MVTTGDGKDFEYEEYEALISDEEANKEESDGDGDYQGPSEGKPRRRRRSGGDRPSGSSQPKKWGPITRDRVIRALLEFGFGRWDKIRLEGSAEIRTIEEIDSFSRSYILQCGRFAGSAGKDTRVESTFVADAIRAASEMEPQIQAGTMVVPEVMLEERFVGKLKTGTARKALIRLEMLLALNSKVKPAITLAVEDVDVEKRLEMGLDTLSDEQKLLKTGKADVASRIALGDIRPKWAGTTIAPWWDLECDQHLLLGLWWYGYGRYSSVRDDPDFCFRKKIEAYLATNPTMPMPKPAHTTSCTLSPDFSWPSQTVTIKMDDGTERQVTFPAKRFSEYRGVYSQPGSIMWVAQVQRPSKVTWHGPFEDEKEAALAYDTEVRNLLGGAVAETNFTEDGQRRPEVNGSSNYLSLVWHRPSKYRGVRAVGAKWTAQISNKHLGTYTSEVEAALKYNEAAKEQSGGSAATYNFSDGLEKEVDAINKVAAVAAAKAEMGVNLMGMSETTPQPSSGVDSTGAPSVVSGELDTKPAATESANAGSLNAESANSQSANSGSANPQDMDVDGDDGQGDGDGEGNSSVVGGSERGGQATMSPVEAHWPDSKTLNKLSQWLIEDPGAMMTGEEQKRLEEEKQLKKVRRHGSDTHRMRFSLRSPD